MQHSAYPFQNATSMPIIERNQRRHVLQGIENDEDKNPAETTSLTHTRKNRRRKNRERKQNRNRNRKRLDEKSELKDPTPEFIDDQIVTVVEKRQKCKEGWKMDSVSGNCVGKYGNTN